MLSRGWRVLQRLGLMLSIVGCLSNLIACQGSIDKGIATADDLLYHEKYVEAERLYRKLLKRLSPKREHLSEEEQGAEQRILERLGKLNTLYLHNYTEALRDYETLVKYYPDSEQAFIARSMMADIYHHKLGDLRAAIDEYQRLINAFPKRPEVRRTALQIIAIYFELKNYEEVRREALALIQSFPDSQEALQANFQIANSYYVEGHYTDAIAIYKNILKEEDQNKLDVTSKALVWFELANCLQELGDIESALDYYYKCLAHHPNPKLVQSKIRRMQLRQRRVRPASGIQREQPKVKTSSR